MAEIPPDATAVTKVTTADGAVTFEFGPDGVTVVLGWSDAVIPWSSWEHIARVYRRRPDHLDTPRQEH